MTNQEMLQSVTFRATRLEVSVALLKADVKELRRRFEAPETAEPVARRATATTTAPPPIPLPPLPIPQVAAAGPAAGEVIFEPAQEDAQTTKPAAQRAAATTETAPETTAETPGFELQFGRWLARIGVVFALFTLIFFGAFVKKNFYHYLGPWSKETVLLLASSALIFTGFRLEKRDSKLLVYGRTLAGGGLACLYYTLYGAIYVPQLRIIGSELFGGFLLLAWSAAVLWLAEKRKSELLSVFALSLAYVSSAITPGNGFVMTADLLLAATAVVFLVRNSWAGLSCLCLIGTYLGFLRQAVVYRGPLDFDWIGTLPFWPSAVYLTGAWLIFTAGILLSRGGEFVAGKRMAFLCLNNGAWAGLLVVAAELGDYPHLGGIFGTVGAAFLIACAIFRIMRADARDIAGAYLAQGLAFATGGVAIAYSGVTRGLLLTIESVFLVAAGTSSRNLILRIGGLVAAGLGTLALLDEANSQIDFPSWLMATGATVMIVNATLEYRARREHTGSSPLAIAIHTSLALSLIVRWVFGVAPVDEINLWLAVIATVLLLCGAALRGSYAIRAGLVLDLVAVAHYFFNDTGAGHYVFTWTNAVAIAFLLAQPALLRHWARDLISAIESWALILISAATLWSFVSTSITAVEPSNLTLGWAGVAVSLIIAGFAAHERRQRWCGLGILVAAFIRVGVHDVWQWSDLYKVLTFLALTVICLGLSFLYYKFADRLKEWL